MYTDNAYVGFELWTVNAGSIFDNILVTDDAEYAKAQADKLFKPTSEGEKDAKQAWDDSKKVCAPRRLFMLWLLSGVLR